MLRSSHILQICVVALLALAVVMVHSAGMTVGGQAVAEMSAPEQSAIVRMLTSRTMIYAIIAVVVMFLASRLNIRQAMHSRGWANPLAYILVFSLVLMALTFVPGMGRSVNGASRWLYLGPKSWGLSFQPSEVVKWVLIVVIAWWCARRQAAMASFFHGLLPALLLIGLACGLIVIEDLGTAALIALVMACLLVAGGARLWQLALMVPPAAAGIAAAIWHSPYRLQRLLTFLNPWEDPRGTGYHSIQSLLAFAQGGLTGRGIGNGVQKFGYLPEDTTDFIFAIICEELGLAGAAMVIGLYLAILWVGLGIVRDCRDTFGRLVGLGVLLTIGFQALINIAVVTVVVPTKGIALPLISSGGTGWILSAFAVGLVAALDEANRFEAEEPLSQALPAVA